jgi:2,5-diketo-D-gluconate reductase B
VTEITSIQTRGIALPKLGLGTYRLTGDSGRAAVESALALGYRHIDTAEMYGNEAEIGAALAASGIPRGEIHVTTKCWPDNLAPDALRRAFDASLKKLKLDVVDLYLIHWPSRKMDLAATLGEMLKLKDQGRVRAIGVANFNIALLRQAVEEIGAPIACNQVEYHAFLSQAKLLGYLRAHQIPLVAYTPLAKGKLAENAVLQKIARKHGASAVQVGLKWLLDQDMVCAIPKATRRESQQANLDALQLKLDDADRAAIAGLPKNERLVISGNAPDWD